CARLGHGSSYALDFW
nr:immunoglobulin heavy chain junction region [Macaca mulatta]MOW21088.1 immunoglobulin heavy chain junction region [Macaca mulatta]